MAPGAQLRHLREQQGLSAQNVADKLCLNIKMIQLLEADKYNELPPPIFVRGYIRNYSKVLDIPSDTLIETFNRLIGEESAPFLTPQLKQKNQTSSEDSWFKALTFTIIIALMILMALWRIYPNNSPTQTASTENNGGAITLPLPSTMDGMPGEDGIPPVSDGDSVPAMGLPGISSTVPPVTPMTPDVLASMSGISSSPPGIPPTLSTTTTPVTNPIAEANSGTGAVAGMDGMGATKTSPPDPNTLVLSYKNSSWTRVTDSTNKKVYEGVPKSGSSITVTGTPPFKVRVGVTAGVIANYQGKELDLATHTERDGRNFLIGSSTPAKPVE
jgi:cytoskeleton protein RodZ